MGRARLHCAGACRCEPLEIDAHRPAGGKGNLSITEVLPVDLSDAPMEQDVQLWAAQCACTVWLRVLPESSSGEHKFKVVALISLDQILEQGRLGFFAWALKHASARDATFAPV